VTLALEEKLPGLIDLKDLAARCLCSTRTLRRLVVRGELPAYRIGRRILIKIEDGTALLASKRVPTGNTGVQQ
jgi:excisionase family DNA binding protein